MPIPISHVKVVKILHHYFTGIPQLKIAQKCGINQATVSRCAEKFKEEASAKGILAAAKEFGIMDEVNALRSLATELCKSKASIEDAKSGVKMVVLFNSLGVPPEEYKILTKVFKKLKDPYFHKAGMKLVKLEESAGKDYTDIINEFEQLGEEIVGRQETIATLSEKQEKEEKTLEELQLARKEKEVEFKEFLKEAEQKKASADAEVNEKLAEVGFTMEKIDKLYPVVEKMNALGISDDKLEIFVGEREVLEEYGITSKKFKIVAEALAKAGDIDAEDLVAKLEEYGALEQAITSMEAKKLSLQPEVQKLSEDKVKLVAEVDGLDKSKSQLETEVGHFKESKKVLDHTINTLEVRKTHLEKHLSVLESDVAKATTEKMALAEEAGQKQLAVSQMEEKLKESDAVDQALKEKKAELHELQTKIAAAGQDFHLYEAFKGAIAGGTSQDIKAFIDSLPLLINEAKAGKYDPEILLNLVVPKLTGGNFDLVACQYCGAELLMVKRGRKSGIGGESYTSIPKQCPDCGFQMLQLETTLVTMLKKEPGPEKEILKIKKKPTTHKNESVGDENTHP